MASRGRHGGGRPVDERVDEVLGRAGEAGAPVGVDVGEFGRLDFVGRPREEHDGGQVEHLAGGPGHPELPFVAGDLEELVGAVVLGAHVEVGGVLHLHGAQHVRVLVLEDDGAGLEEEVPPPHDGLHRGDVHVEQPQRHGVLVHHVVEEVAARAPLVEAPAVALRAQRGLEGRVGLADQGPDAQRGRLPDGALGHQALGQLERRVVHEALADAEGAARPARPPPPFPSASSTELATGFCTDTCLPASSAAITWSWCRWVGVRISTASMESSASMSARSG